MILTPGNNASPMGRPLAYSRRLIPFGGGQSCSSATSGMGQLESLCAIEAAPDRITLFRLTYMTGACRFRPRELLSCLTR